jgi:hypothetical protein
MFDVALQSERDLSIMDRKPQRPYTDGIGVAVIGPDGKRSSTGFTPSISPDRPWINGPSIPAGIDVRILRLRRKLEIDPSSPRIIQTERGVGCVFALPVEEI